MTTLLHLYNTLRCAVTRFVTIQQHTTASCTPDRTGDASLPQASHPPLAGHLSARPGARLRCRCLCTSSRVGVNTPNATLLVYALSPATARPRLRASAGANPRRSATTAAQSVSTGARLIFSPCSFMVCCVITCKASNSRHVLYALFKPICPDRSAGTALEIARRADQSRAASPHGAAAHARGSNPAVCR
jgi:hypothetical protein